MNWKRIEVEDGPDAGEHWLQGNIGPFQIEIFPPWQSDDYNEWHLVVNTGADDLVEDVAMSEADAKRAALGWLNRKLRDWQDEIDSGMAAIPAGRDTCPIHDFEQPCPSCAMVAIDAGVEE